MIKEKYGIYRNIEEESLKILQSYDWPGNVRQLKNIIERVCLLAVQPEITVKAVLQELDSHKMIPREKNRRPFSVSCHCGKEGTDEFEKHGTLKERVAAFEKRIIKKTLSERPEHQKSCPGSRL